jgi:hypothetical protein
MTVVKNPKKYLFNAQEFFYLLFALTVITIFFTNPFLKYPFDMFRHLLMIDDYYTYPEKIHDTYKPYWHHFWARLFHLIQIDNSQIFLRAKIIHTIQTMISFFAIFYFTNTFIRLLFANIQTIYINYMALWSTLIWFTIFATFSEGYHLIWIEWYSLSYQITLPLMFILMAITLSLIYDNLHLRSKILHIITMIILSIIILKIHSMEYIYFLLYIFILSILYSDKLIYFFKNHIFLLIITIMIISLFLLNIHAFFQFIYYREPAFLQYVSYDKLPMLWEKIIKDGNFVVARLSRSQASINELFYVSLVLVIVLLLLASIRHIMHKNKFIHFRLLCFLAITSFFVFIPINTYTAGLSAVITHVNLVNRFYYSSLVFMVVPITVFYFIQHLDKKNILILNFIILTILLSVFVYSKYDIGHNQNYYKNIQSFKYAFNERKVGFQLSKEHINIIGIEQEKHQHINSNHKPYFYAREDIAFVLKYVYQQEVFLPKHWNGRGIDSKKYINAYNTSERKNKVLFPIPESFPNYIPYQ